jgi:hypothetical protein
MATKARTKKLGKAKSIQEVKPLTMASGPNLSFACASGKHIATATITSK